MKSVTVLTCVMAISMLAGCTPPPINAEPPVQRERMAYLEHASDIPVLCTVGTDCAQKWARAQQWVVMHSAYSVKTNTDSEITTYGPIDPTTDSAFTVTKVPHDANTNSITFTSSCGKAAVCSPTTLELKSNFKKFVMYGN